MKKSAIAVTVTAALLIGLIATDASARKKRRNADPPPQHHPDISYITFDKTLKRILHRDLVIVYDNLELVGQKLKLVSHLENRGNTSLDLHIQTFFLDENGRRLNDQTIPKVVRVDLHGTAIYEALSNNETAAKAEVQISYKRMKDTRGKKRRR